MRAYVFRFAPESGTLIEAVGMSVSCQQRTPPEERKATIIMVLSHKTGTEAAQCSYCINGRLGVKVTIVQAYKIFVFPPY